MMADIILEAAINLAILLILYMINRRLVKISHVLSDLGRSIYAKPNSLNQINSIGYNTTIDQRGYSRRYVRSSHPEIVDVYIEKLKKR